MTTANSIPIQGVLFDLDGTLLDTAPDLLYALNIIRRNYGLSDVSLDAIKHIISLGSKAMMNDIKDILDIKSDHQTFEKVIAQFYAHYQQHIADSTQLFPGMENVLNHLEAKNIPWGIVTNKLSAHAHALLKALNLAHKPVCVICGDTLPNVKPHPEPILHACKLLQQNPKHCVYVGDSSTDVKASKSAGTVSLVALYGYIGKDEDPYQWQADGYIQNPQEIIEWL